MTDLKAGYKKGIPMHEAPAIVGIGRVSWMQPYPHVRRGWKHFDQVTIDQPYHCFKAHPLFKNKIRRDLIHPTLPPTKYSS